MPRALDPYRAKRDFSRTPEPAGGRAAKGKALRFVVQKHAARRLHYDFRLEWKGVLKSWAVTNEPVRDPAVKRLAVETEDHPLDYATFEGTIPQGEYGGGTVEIWDDGLWTPRDPAHVERDLAAGQLKFVLLGRRMEGGYALVRLRPKPKERAGRNNWLLVKENDPFARRGEEAAAPAAPAPEPQPRARSMPAPAAPMPSSHGRSRRAAASAAGMLPPPMPAPSPPARPAPSAFLPLQLCLTAETPPTGPEWVHELKLDGYRLQLAVAGGAVTLRTRTGLDWTARFPAIAAAAASLPDCVLDGETVALDADGIPDFALLQATLSGEKRQPLVYFAFDLLRHGAEDLRPRPLRARKDALRRLLGRSDTVRYVQDFAAPGAAILASACRMSMEGVVSKRVDRPYAEGRTGAWVKAKCRPSEEFAIGGWSLDRHGAGLGALLVGARRDGAFVYLGRVGTGFGAGTSRRLLGLLAPHRRQTSPFDGRQPARSQDVTWAEPALVAQVAYAGWTEQGLLRQASFIALREDKPAAQVAAPARAPPPKRPAGGARLTSPERALWPASGAQPAVTKANLAAYYERLAPLLMAQIGGRPLSIVRTPDGIGGERFFQRHLTPGASPLLRPVRVEGQAKPFVMIEEEAGLLALAQISATELHPWGARAAAPEVPDRLVFDLDPGPGVDFATVRAAALRMNQVLEACGMTGFPRLSGGKGVHVVVALAVPRRGPKPAWPEAKQFALDVCKVLEREAPRAYVTKMTKSLRDGRIFLDYLRNGAMATAVASWSPRAREGAPVARPLTWRTLAKESAADAARLPALLRGARPRDPWAELEASAAALPGAIARLKRL